MKLRHLFALPVYLCCIFFLSAAAIADTQAKDGVPVAEVAVNSYTFSSVVDGTEVVHDFIITNKGTAVLEIVKIKTG